MTHKAENIYRECIKQFIGGGGMESLGGTSLAGTPEESLSNKIYNVFNAIIQGTNPELNMPGEKPARYFYNRIKSSFTDYYSGREDDEFFCSRAGIITGSSDPRLRARAISELWAPDLVLDDDEIYENWKLRDVKPNLHPYKADEILIQLNSLYEPAGMAAPAGIGPELTAEYQAYMESGPEKIAVYDHPVPIFTDGAGHELVKCLLELDVDMEFEKECGVFPRDKNLNVLISISTTHRGLDVICEKWLKTLIKDLGLTNIDCFLLSEHNARKLDDLLGDKAEIFTVQGKYACHFGALKYAQLIFGKAFGIRAGFKLDTDEGIHSSDLKKATGKTWFEHLAHAYWGGSAVNSEGRKIKLGFNVGEYVDSRDLDSLGYEKAIRTPEVKPGNDLRGPYLLFNKGAAQAKGTLLFNRARQIEDFISHPLVKGGGYGVDNETLRKAAPVGFSMVGRAEDQQFYFSAINEGVQGIFSPGLRIIHYKAAVAEAEGRSEVGRTIADIYRMILFRKLMGSLGVIEQTRPFPAVYARELSEAQAFFLWMYLTGKKSAEGDEAAAEEYLTEGLGELIPLLRAVDDGSLMNKYNEERAAWRDFTSAVDSMDRDAAVRWLESLKI